MTREHRDLLPLGEIQAIRFRCKECQATLGYSPTNWKNIPSVCPNCNHRWAGSLSFEEKTITGLCQTLEDFSKIAGQLGCTVSIEFDGETQGSAGV